MPQTPPDPFAGRLGISIAEAGVALGVKRDTIYRMLADGRLVATKIGRRTLVHVDSIRRVFAADTMRSRPRTRRD
jgi:excisionase family DNA binding protein